MLTDTHAHLFWDSFSKDLNEVVKRAIDSGVTSIINVGTDIKTSRLALEQVETKLSQFPNLTTYSSIGIHPHEAIKYIKNPEQLIDKDIKKLEKIYHSNPQKVVAIGECGLDYMFESNPDFVPSDLTSEKIKELQRLLLQKQVGLAKKLDLPLLIHTRDSWHEIFDFISDHFGILHCFSGDLEIAKKALKTNFLISFPGTITYPKNEYLREVAKTIPLEKMVFETDCPFLPPQSIRGKRNEPSSIKEIAELVASLRGIPLEEVGNQTSKNARRTLKI